jgi:DNA-binding PadR family transcriptional regulator
VSRLSTKHVVLGLLVERNSYGYALQQRVSERFGFLELADSAIYKTLERLAADGCVEEVSARRSGRNARVLYRATPRGVEEFESWMAHGTERPFLRDELHAKLALSGPEDLPNLLAAVEAQSQQCLADLAELGRQARPSVTASNVSWNVTSLLLVDDFRARFLECMVDWLAVAAEAIQDEIDDRPTTSTA